MKVLSPTRECTKCGLKYRYMAQEQPFIKEICRSCQWGNKA